MNIDTLFLSKKKWRIIITFWLVFTLLASIFIPEYDFSFDGVKIWLVLSCLLFVFFYALGVFWNCFQKQ